MRIAQLSSQQLARSALAQHSSGIPMAPSRGAVAVKGSLEASNAYRPTARRDAIRPQLLDVVAAANGSKMPQVLRFAQLSPARQTLVRVLQATNFGEIQGIHVEDADPIFDGGSVVVL